MHPTETILNQETGRYPEDAPLRVFLWHEASEQFPIETLASRKPEGATHGRKKSGQHIAAQYSPGLKMDAGTVIADEYRRGSIPLIPARPERVGPTPPSAYQLTDSRDAASG